MKWNFPPPMKKFGAIFQREYNLDCPTDIFLYDKTVDKFELFAFDCNQLACNNASAVKHLGFDKERHF